VGDEGKTNVAAVPSAPKEPRIGIILVHGIGEQRRFEHLDGELRPLIAALVRAGEAVHGKTDPDDPPPNVTVEIVEGAASTLHADQDTWSTEFGAPVRVIVNDNGVRKHIHFHEVWWADVNEPYSLRKQIRFWCWGLSIWLVPSQLEFDLPGSAAMSLPKFPPEASESQYSLRFRLFCVCNIFAMAGFSLGAIVFFLKRLFGFQAPPIVKILVNYIGAVKLYSQRRRNDGGFLDAYTEPPRVSIRRRMIRTLADVALADYERWYVFAHSLGSVVAFNGLQENAHAIPNYLSEEQYRDLVKGVKGKGTPLAGRKRDCDETGPTKRMLPARPLWLNDDEVVYRDRLLSKFRGLLTYGSPLDKFAAIWPARVPINKKDEGLAVHNGEKTEWINVYDPTDPVGAHLDAFARPKDAKSETLLEPTNFAYAAHPVLLLSHLHYLDGKTGRTDRLADRLMQWVLGGNAFVPGAIESKSPWLEVSSWRRRRRSILAFAMWIFAYLFLTFLGALSLPLWEKLFAQGGGALVTSIKEAWHNFFTWGTAPRGLQDVIDWVAGYAGPLRTAWVANVWPWIEPVWSGLQAFLFWIFSIVVVPLWLLGEAFVAIFGRNDGALTWICNYLGLPFVIEEMVKLSIGVAIFVIAAGIVGWLFVFDRKPINPPVAPVAAAVRLAGWVKELASRSKKEETGAVSR
jgi:hypothetical protein